MEMGALFPWSATALLVLILSTSSALAQNAAGRLPWGQAADGGISNSDPASEPKAPSPFIVIPVELFSRAYGVAYYGFDSESADSVRYSQQEIGVSLTGSGYLFDPRFWSQQLTLNIDHVGHNATSGREIGIKFNGTFLPHRPFPLHVFYYTANQNQSASFFSGHGSYRSYGLTWMLHNEQLWNIGVIATVTHQASDSLFLGFPGTTEPLIQTLSFGDSKNLGVRISRNLFGWRIDGNEYYIKQNSSELSLRDRERRGYFQTYRTIQVGSRGILRNAGHYRTDSKTEDRGLNRSYSILDWNSSLSYRHSSRLHGSYGISYSRSTTKAAGFSLLNSSGASSGSPQNLTPSALQALLHGESSSIGAHAGWIYSFSRSFGVGGNVGHAFLNQNEPTTGAQTLLLSSYTNAGGFTYFQRKFGRWNVFSQVHLARRWKNYHDGGNAVDDSHEVSFGVSRKFRRWEYRSEFTFSDTSSGAGNLLATDLKQRQEIWKNKLNTRLSPRIALNLGTSVEHVSSNSSGVLTTYNYNTTIVTGHGALSGVRWNLAGETGANAVDSGATPFSSGAPLSNGGNPASVPYSLTTITDHFANVSFRYRTRRHWKFRSRYRYDNFENVGRGTTTYKALDVGIEYHMRRTTIVAGFQMGASQGLQGSRDYNRIYVQIRRPFRLY